MTGFLEHWRASILVSCTAELTSRQWFDSMIGDDADTVGAVYGGIAGAYYGVEEVSFKEELQKKALVDGTINGFVEKLSNVS